MPQDGFEPTIYPLVTQWSLNAFCHTYSCFPRVKIRIYKNVQLRASFNFCSQVTTVLLHWSRMGKMWSTQFVNAPSATVRMHCHCFLLRTFFIIISWALIIHQIPFRSLLHFCRFFPCSLTVFHRGRRQKSEGRLRDILIECSKQF